MTVCAMWQSLPYGGTCHNGGVSSPRTARRIDDARSRVVSAAWELLEHRGWSAVTVADICERADVAPRTFHRYFPDKAEVLFSDAAQHEGALTASLDRHPFDAAAPRAYLEAVMDDMAAQVEPYTAAGFAARGSLVGSAPELKARDLVKRARLEALVIAALGKRLGQAERLRAKVLAAVAMHACYAGLEEWAASGGDLRAHLQLALDAADLGPRAR